MKLFYGTGNQSKLRNMRAILAGMPIELITPADLGIRLPAVEETGATPLENAVLKPRHTMLSPACPASRWIPGCIWKGCRRASAGALRPPGKRQGTFRRGVHCLLSAAGAPVRRQAQGTVHQRAVRGAERPAAERSRRAAGFHRLVLDRGNAPSHPVKGLSHGQHCGRPPDRAVLGGGRFEGRTKRQGFRPCHRRPPVLFGTAAKRPAL